MTTKLCSTIVMLLVSLTVNVGANAQAESTIEIPKIEIENVRDPAFIPYHKAYDLASHVAEISAGKVSLLFRVTSKSTSLPLQGLKLSIQGSKLYETITPSTDGVFKIPLNSDALRDNADFLLNQKRGKVKVAVIIAPSLHGETFTYQSVIGTIEAGQGVRKDALPWYLRLLTPPIKTLGVCYAQPGNLLRIEGNDRFAFPADVPEKNDVGQPVYCANLSMVEHLLTPGDVLRPAPGWEPLFTGEML